MLAEIGGKPGKIRGLMTDILFDIVGCSIFSVGVQCFSSPNNIAPGGVTGICIMLEYLFGLPVSIMSFVLNVPLLLLAWRLLGHRFTLKTLRTVAIMTATLALAERIILPYRGEMVLAALFGGVTDGIGLAIVFVRGSTTGGTDVASRLIQIKFPNFSVGRLMLAVDACVLIMSAVVYQGMENALYGLIAIFTATRIIDSILYGLDTGKVMLVISDSYREIAADIDEQLERGSTFLQGQGAYTGADRPVLMCAIRKNQYHKIKQIVYGRDPSAFVLAMEASEVIGEGFKIP